VNPVRVGQPVDEPQPPDPAELDRPDWTELADLHALAEQASAENFPVALRVLPKGPRASLERIYDFARFVDDVGDEAPGDRLALLDQIELDVRRLPEGGARLAPVRALAPVIGAHDIPLQPLLDLIQANHVDQVVTSYESFDDLLGYCRLSAAPIGLMVLHVAGAADERNIADSDRVCAALQVLEHCQDVREDALAGRVYLPASELHGADLTVERTSPFLRSVVRTQVERSLELLQPGRALVRRLHGWSRIAVAGYVAGGLATADALKAGDFDVLAHELRPSKARTAYHALRLTAGL
jgi:squalene synthase HpnC